MSEIRFDVVGTIEGREYSEHGEFVLTEHYDALMDIARSLTVQLHATFGNTEFHEDCIRDLEELSK